MSTKRKVGNSFEFSNVGNRFVIIKTTEKELPYLDEKYGFEKHPATYVVFGDYEEAGQHKLGFYVGETSTNVLSRLKESFAKRPWIQEVFIITSTKGYLTMEIVKSLEYMIFQALKYGITSKYNTVVEPSNAKNGTIGYRMKLSNNDNTFIASEAFGLFFEDAFAFSKYNHYFDNFELDIRLPRDCKIVKEKREPNRILAGIRLGSTNSILAGSIISIEMDTLDNASDDVKDLFMSILKSKCIYPILRDQKVQWKLGTDIPMSIVDLNNAIVLISNSLNSNVGNSLFNNTTRRS